METNLKKVKMGASRYGINLFTANAGSVLMQSGVGSRLLDTGILGGEISSVLDSVVSLLGKYMNSDSTTEFILRLLHYKQVSVNFESVCDEALATEGYTYEDLFLLDVSPSYLLSLREVLEVDYKYFITYGDLYRVLIYKEGELSKDLGLILKYLDEHASGVSVKPFDFTFSFLGGASVEQEHVLRQVLHLLDLIELSGTETDIVIFNYLYNYLLNTSYTLPSFIESLLVRLVMDGSSGLPRVYDFNAGVGNLLGRVQKEGCVGTLYGGTSNKRDYSFLRVCEAFQGIKPDSLKVSYYDGDYPDFFGNYSGILSNLVPLPVTGELREDFGIISESLRRLETGKVMAVLVPEYVLTNTGVLEGLRREWVEGYGALEAVLEVKSSEFPSHFILVFRNLDDGEEFEGVRFSKFELEGTSRSDLEYVYNKFSLGLQEGTGFCYKTVEELQWEDFNLSPSHYIF